MAKVEKRAGSYSTRVSITDPDTGERSQKRITARTKKDLDRQVTQLRAEYQRGEYVEPDMTPLAEWLGTWHGKYKAGDATRYNRGMHIRVHLVPDQIGKVALSRLRYAHVQDWADRKLEAGYSVGYVRKLAQTLSMALDQARRRRLISVNPCDDLELPEAGPRRWNVLSDAQARALVHETRDEPEHALWVLAITLGIRRGELIGLRWSDVDLAAGTMRIERSLTRDANGKWIIGREAKTDAGRRTLRLPAVCLDALKRHRFRQLERRLAAADAWSDTDAVFDAGLGEHWTMANVLYGRFLRIARRLDFPEGIRQHDLRHSAATHMIRNGIPLPAVAKILGHADPAITMKVYAHVLDDMEEVAIETIDAMFQPQSDQIVTTAS